MPTKPTPRTQRMIGIRLSAACIALLMYSAVPAQSVQKCQIDGRVVFQTAPCPRDARVAAAVAAPQPPPVAASGARKKTLAELLHERDAGDRSPRAAAPAQIDGASVLRARMGAV